MQSGQKDLGLTIFYFLLSTLLTAWFIELKISLYESMQQMILSGTIAGAKWGVQLLVAFFFMGRKRFEFMRRIAFVCLMGSVILLLVLPLAIFNLTNQQEFVSTLLLSVVVMIVLYFTAVKKTGLSLRWFFGWIACLLIAVFLQLTIVFHII